ncbi:MAG TPA: PDZ domain-containing protein [Candidatus Eremiobacteraeota bacterium]|nr:MAG: Periplasmic pH-dependent serine endoprotease DegQ precursor [bacterium ADurb.Bin363]HPZ09524.1 PDZ domain-containing protein [Candidatus Eremiobacteraeota bacterium]
MMKRRFGFAIKVCAIIFLLLLTFQSLLAQGLIRKGRLGVGVTEITDEIQLKSDLESKKGVFVKEVFPDTSAQESGMEKEDIILKINGIDIVNVSQFLNLMDTYRGGDELLILLWRNKERIEKKVILKPFPKESSPDFDVFYMSVTVDERTCLRTIVTKPKIDKKYPAVLLIQGLSCSSIDYPFDDKPPYKNPYKSIVYSLTEQGFVTMRVEKSAVGDSEGIQAKDIDFNTEVFGFQKALEMLKTCEFVDSQNVFIFGHSMGGVMAPVIANNISVRGIIVFGTVSKTWIEYELENSRRQGLLKREDFVRLEEGMKNRESLLYHLYIEKLTPKEIILRYPELRGSFDDEEHMYGRHYMFFRQLYDINLSEKWQNANSSVLAIWGESDFVSGFGDHQLIVDIVNKYYPGKGTLIQIENMDHSFLYARSMSESYHNGNNLSFNPVIIETMSQWMKKLIK